MLKKEERETKVTGQKVQNLTCRNFSDRLHLHGSTELVTVEGKSEQSLAVVITWRSAG